ncbi:hypothetical protein G6F68_000585 [Rhizopus microsporus]|nr:hypothetical protein G6F68_000585 [Rhizopus microsporus]
MLACAQDIFFTSDSNTINQSSATDPFLDSQQHKDTKRPRMKHSSTMQHLQHLKQEHSSNKHKEEVWPPDVEAAFIEALETIPKLGRRKILVNGKPCGRNEIIYDLIFSKTQKNKTRKQVSSHIQVLKNTRKNDPHFMRLLTDSVDVDEGFATIQQPVRQHQRKPRMSASTSRRSQLNNAQKAKSSRPGGSMSSDDSSMSSTPSPADYVFDMVYQDQQNSLTSMLDLKDPFFEPFFNSLISSSTTAEANEDNSNNNNMPLFDNNSLFSLQDFSSISTTDVLQQLFPLTSSTSESGPTVVDLLEQQNSINDFLTSQKQQQQQQQQQQPQKKSLKKSGIRKYNKKQKNNSLKTSLSHPNLNLFQSVNSLATSSLSMPGIGINALDQAAASTWIDPSVYPLWPNYICLYLEYSLPYDTSSTMPHTLAAIPECIPSYISSIDSPSVAKEKCPPISELTLSPALTILAAKVKLNLGISTSDFFFNNTSFFETRDRRTIECTTTIYSFGNVVLESKEVQQALWLNESKYMYSFSYVNQFFDAFMKGIRSLQSWEEVDIAINNLCVVQVYEDVETKLTQSTASTTSLVSQALSASTSADVSLSAATEELILTDNPNTSTASGTNAENNNITLPDIAAPLLVMVYEFERGQGTIDISLVDTSVPPANLSGK